MLPIKNILVPTDFERPSDDACEMAIDLALKLDASVTLVHACESLVMAYSGAPFLPINDLTPSIQEAAKHAMDKQLAAYKERFPRIKGVLRWGAPWEEILGAAHDLPADLIVMGTHGRRGLPRAILGSVAEKLVRLSNVPVLTVRHARDGK